MRTRQTSKELQFSFIKDYITLLTIVYLVILITKFIFITYLQTNYSEYTVLELISAILFGYKFDLAASAAISLLIVLCNFNKIIYSLVGAFLIFFVFLLQISDILYFNESNRHIGYEILDLLNDTQSLFMTAYSQHTTITLLSIIFGFILFIYILSMLLDTYKKQSINIYILNKVIILIIAIFFIRGMTQSIPLNPWQSNQIGDSKLASITLNATYNVIYALANKNKKISKIKISKLEDKIYQDSIKRLFNNSRINVNLPIVKTKPNVIFFFLESWSAYFLKSYGYKYETTPFFDSLLKKSIRPRFMIANGHRTTEGMFATLASLQNPLGKSVAKTHLQDYYYDSIINKFNNHGYNSGFFQGTSKETSGTGSFAQSLGFKYSYGKKDIDIKIYEENYWGVHDVDLYNFVKKKIKTKLKEPFVIGINGATTHDDKIPKSIKSIDFTNDKKINNLLNAFHFSDIALKKFITYIEKKYPNTIFVLFADHCGGYIPNLLQNYIIPFAIYSKNIIKNPYYLDTIMSQRDIAPTIYDMVIGDHRNNKTFFSGRSIFSDKKFFCDYYNNGVLGWIENNKNIEIDINTNKLKCFKLNNLSKKQIKCDDSHNILKENALTFTQLSQDILFNNKVKTINIHKK